MNLVVAKIDMELVNYEKVINSVETTHLSGINLVRLKKRLYKFVN